MHHQDDSWATFEQQSLAEVLVVNSSKPVRTLLRLCTHNREDFVTHVPCPFNLP